MPRTGPAGQPCSAPFHKETPAQRDRRLALALTPEEVLRLLPAEKPTSKEDYDRGE